MWHLCAKQQTRYCKNHNFFKSFRVKNINELVITSDKLTNNFMGLVTNGLGSDMASKPPVGPCRSAPSY
jgi:hypothetical protein